jgi:hypothetical protein
MLGDDAKHRQHHRAAGHVGVEVHAENSDTFGYPRLPRWRGTQQQDMLAPPR